MVDKVGSVGLQGGVGIAGIAGGVAAPGTRPLPPQPLPAGASGAESGLAFDQILQQQLAQPSLAPVGGAPAATAESQDALVDGARVRFSAHAQQRLAQAAVQLGPMELKKLEAAVDKAGLKGGRESLILLDDLAFVVSVKNRTVITAVGADRMADNVFTKIDSVVIARGAEDA
jgi:flagellar operon protein